MAHGRPWYQRNGGDFLLGCMGMPDADHKWAYSALIDMMNDRDRPIPDDAGFICGFTGLSRKKWSLVRRYLLDHRDAKGEPDKIVINDDGDLTNPRFERERAKRRDNNQKAVEGGREGGRRSAAKRAAEKGQQTLDLGEDRGDYQGDYRPVYPPDKCPDSALDTPEKVEGATPENNGLAQAPPQGTRARKEARGESIEVDSSSTANPIPRAAQADVAAELPDLLGVTNRLCRLGGVSLVRPAAITANLDIVKHWIAEGADVETVLVKAITDQFTNTREKTIGSLSFYGARVAKLMADANGGTGPRPPSSDWTQADQAAYLAWVDGGRKGPRPASNSP